MKLFYRSLLILFVPIVFPEELEIENNVIVINNESFDDIINKNQPILVNFYAPWCKFSQQLHPQFEKAAENLIKLKPSIKLAKVDVTTESELAERFKIKSYPTLILFKNDHQIPYNKGHNSKVIEEWLLSKVEQLIIHINSTHRLDQIKQKAEVLFIINKNKFVDLFENLAENIDDIQFATMDTLLFDSLFSYDKKTSIVLIRKMDNNVIPFNDEEINKENLLKFIKSNEVPSVVKYSFYVGGKIFPNPYKHLHFLIFMEDKFEEAASELIEPSKNHPEISFVMIDISDNTTSALINYFKVDISKLPHSLLSDAKHKKLFLPDFQEINGKKINQFLNGVKDGKIEQFLKSQELPKNWDSEPVKVLVGKNFEEVVYDKKKTVFVEFYAPWCNYCKQLEPIWERLAKDLVNIPNLIIGKIDKTENDIKNIEIKSFPTLKLFLKDTNEIINYNGVRTKEQLKEFLSKYVNLNDSVKNDEL